MVDPTLHRFGDSIKPVMRGYKLVNPFHENRRWLSIEGGLSAPIFYSHTADTSAVVNSLAGGQHAAGSVDNRAGQVEARDVGAGACDNGQQESGRRKEEPNGMAWHGVGL